MARLGAASTSGDSRPIAADTQTDAWSAHFDPAAFTAFNPDLTAEAQTTRRLRRLQRDGISRLARFSFTRTSVPAYVRETYPTWAVEDDGDLYHRCLDDGLSWPTSGLDHLRAPGLSAEPVPTAVEWARRVAEHPGVPADR